ncbi:MAG: GNAT family N-acetyltransferase [Aliarcobacter sp.]|nr:GNAT family N-acetyltransferase [Aliarcobacter sp.]
MEIKVATINDIMPLCELLNELFSMEKEFIVNKELQIKGLKKILENNSIGNIIVATKDKKIIAMVNLLYTISTALGAKVAILEDMIVSKDFQNQNIGSTLLEFAKTFAKEIGCKRITLLTDNDNFKAHTFYEKNGFEKSSMIPFRIKL